ncbi:MAG: hypothetical protein ACE5F5_06970 [Acidimicrobiia bacterium]
MRRWTLFGIWSLVLVLTTALTWQIVSAADGRVNDRPLAVNIAAPIIEAATATTPVSNAPGAATTLPELTPSTESTVAPTGQTTSSTTTTTEAGQLPPATTEHPTTTTTTASEKAWAFETVPTKGGTVTVSYRPGEVVFEAATPVGGYRFEVEREGPPEVEVEFESYDLKIEVRVKWSDGELDIRVTESKKDHDDD